jgi:hypothetical protein
MNVTPLKTLLESYEKRLIRAALRAEGGRQRGAARRLCLLPSTLHEKMKRLGIRSGRARPLPGHGTADSPAVVVWQACMRPGSTLALHGLDGGVRVDASEGSEVRVKVRRPRQAPGADGADVERPAGHDVRILEHDHGVTVCALRVSSVPPRSVALEAEVPSGVGVMAAAINGDVEIVGVSGSVHATTTNGQVVFLPAVSTPRPVVADRSALGIMRVQPDRPSGRYLSVASPRGRP